MADSPRDDRGRDGPATAAAAGADVRSVVKCAGQERGDGLQRTTYIDPVADEAAAELLAGGLGHMFGELLVAGTLELHPDGTVSCSDAAAQRAETVHEQLGVERLPAKEINYPQVVAVTCAAATELAAAPPAATTDEDGVQPGNYDDEGEEGAGSKRKVNRGSQMRQQFEENRPARLERAVRLEGIHCAELSARRLCGCKKARALALCWDCAGSGILRCSSCDRDAHQERQCANRLLLVQVPVAAPGPTAQAPEAEGSGADAAAPEDDACRSGRGSPASDAVMDDGTEDAAATLAAGMAALELPGGVAAEGGPPDGAGGGAAPGAGAADGVGAADGLPAPVPIGAVDGEAAEPALPQLAALDLLKDAAARSPSTPAVMALKVHVNTFLPLGCEDAPPVKDLEVVREWIARL